VRRQIVILDAEPVVRFTVGAILDRAGYDVVRTDDPICVVNLLKHGTPSLVICDAALPDITCSEAIRLFRHYRPEIAILILSCEPSYEIVMRCRREDCDFFLKPFKAAQFKTKVSSVLRQRSSHAIPETVPPPCFRFTLNSSVSAAASARGGHTPATRYGES
jgi:DNA-binding response OmpR family regulator